MHDAPKRMATQTERPTTRTENISRYQQRDEVKEHLSQLAHFLSHLNPRNLASNWVEKQMDKNMREASYKEVTFDMFDTQLETQQQILQSEKEMDHQRMETQKMIEEIVAMTMNQNQEVNLIQRMTIDEDEVRVGWGQSGPHWSRTTITRQA